MFEKMFGTTNSFAAQFSYDTNPALIEEKDIDSKPAPQEMKVFASLEEIYNGCTKQLKVSRRIDSVDGSTRIDERTLAVEIGRGWKQFTKITFEGEGDAAVVNGKTFTGDVQFVLHDRPHPVYKRLPNNDLAYTHTLTLSEALCGSVLTLQSLDGRTLTIALSEVIGPTSKHTVANEGMPKSNGGRANLVIDFILKFPDQLSMTQKQALKTVLNESSAQ